MFSPKADSRLEVRIPGSAEDRPSWTKVGVITAIGFLIGIGWPRVMGVRLGPSVPADVAVVAAASASAVSPREGPSAVPGAPATAGAPAAAVSAQEPAASAAVAPPAATPSVAVAVAVGHGVVFACRSSDGDALKGPDCGTLPGLDGLVMPRLRKLAECPEAAAAIGKLHLVARLDFGRGSLSLDLGKGQTVASADPLLACAKADLSGTALTGVAHDHPRYSVAYTITFEHASAGGADPGASSARTAAPAGDEGAAQVVWEVAIVRDAPKTGKVLARLARGTSVHLGAPRDGWYPVKFGDSFASDGWLYRGAVGK